jgi:hypothetical protein
MDFKDRLARLDPSRYAATLPRSGKAELDYSCLLPGKAENNACGSYWHIRTELSPAHRHGNFLLGNFLERNLEHLRYAARRKLAGKLLPQNLLFMDTETTGLAGGAGTMAFLVGIGYFNHDHFVIEQYFVRRFAEERAVLGQFFNRLESTARAQGALVTFNGTCYDLPLLHNRAVLQRFSHIPAVDAHIDLLYPSRRLWRRHLPDCALKTLEGALAGVIRQGDVPAYLIPEMYFHYLRTSDPTPLKDVFYHNQLDILSMVALLDVMLMLFSREGAGDYLPVDRLSMARMVEEVDREEMSPDFYDRLMEGSGGEEERKQLMLGKGRLHKRKRNFEEAVHLWEDALTCRGFSPEPYEELAKVYEHHLADLHKARNYTERALEQVSLMQQLHPERVREQLKENLMVRLRRLQRKLRRGKETL